MDPLTTILATVVSFSGAATTRDRIGGEKVELEIHTVSRIDRVATVHATRLTPTYRFDDVLTLTATDDTWTIASAAVVATPVRR